MKGTSSPETQHLTFLPVATDTIFSDTLAVDSSVNQAQVFVVRALQLLMLTLWKVGSNLLTHLRITLGDGELWTNSSVILPRLRYPIKVMDILGVYHICNWHSEPYHQNQNHAEWRYRCIKAWTNTVMNRSGAPATCWLLCLIYVCYLFNHIACADTTTWWGGFHIF